MATQFSDPGLGGQSGFASQYTPIQFAPLVSLTGPVAAPTAPAAPEAPQAGMPRMLLPQESGYEGIGPAFEGEPIGTRMSTPAGRQAELANLANAAGFLTSPFTSMANYVLTGQSPAMQFGVGNQREAFGLQQSDVMPQGLMPQGGLSGMFGGIRDFLGGLMGQGQQQASVPLTGMGPMLSAGGEGMGGAAFNDAEAIARSMGVGDERAVEIGRTAMGLVAQGLDPISAVTLATNYGAYATRPEMNAPVGLPANFASGANPVAPASVAQASPIAPQAQIESSYDFGGGNTPDNSGISYDMSDFGFR